MRELKIKTTAVFEDLIKSNKRFVLSVGSSRSSKTYSMLQWIIYYCAENQNEGKYISVVRKSFPSLRRTVYREFVEVLTKYNLYDEKKHNKTEHKINVFGNWVEFFSLNDSQKIRGASRDILYLNEVNEIDYESAQQLFLRTKERVFMDENPSDVWHWSMKYQNRNDCDYIHSTYKKNPFLTKETINQIESYKDNDENFYRIYALGLPGYAITTIYTHYNFYDNSDLVIEGSPIYDDWCYGLDVGYSHIMALVKCYFKEDTVWVEEVIAEGGLTSNRLIDLMNQCGVSKDKYIWVDSAAPAMIKDLTDAGFNAKSADKSVKEGIDLLKSKKLFINNESVSLIDELKRYSWKTKGEQIVYEPVKINDDLCVTGDTLVTTKDGDIPIMSIAVGQEVLTRSGWKKCLRVMNNGTKKVYDFTFNNVKISATEDHKILADNKWIELRQVEQGMILNMRLNMMDLYLDYIKVIDILQDTTGIRKLTALTNNTFIDIFGLNTTDLYRKDLKFTTRMRIDSIMISQISNFLHHLITNQYTAKKDIEEILNSLKNLQKKAENQRPSRNGYDQMNVSNIIKVFGVILLESIYQNSQLKSVGAASPNLKQMLSIQNSAQINVSQSSEEIQELMMRIENVIGVILNSELINIQRLGFVAEVVVLSITKTNERPEIVFDITIDGKPEYFANNILIHNCDAMRYGIWNTYKKASVKDWNLLF